MRNFGLQPPQSRIDRGYIILLKKRETDSILSRFLISLIFLSVFLIYHAIFIYLSFFSKLSARTSTRIHLFENTKKQGTKKLAPCFRFCFYFRTLKRDLIPRGLLFPLYVNCGIGIEISVVAIGLGAVGIGIQTLAIYGINSICKADSDTAGNLYVLCFFLPCSGIENQSSRAKIVFLVCVFKNGC